MALPSTVHRFEVDLSDVDRGVYERLEFRLAVHPSETVRYALVRVLAWLLEYSPELELGPGLCRGDEPAASARGEYGTLALWLDVGAPSADRLHKAAKLADRVVVYTHKDLPTLRREWSSRTIHGADGIRLVVVPDALLDALEARFARSNAWGVLRNEGVVYVTTDGDTVSGTFDELPLLDS